MSTFVSLHLEQTYYMRDRYIWAGSRFPRVVGRVFGGDGSASYQIAARPHDECSVPGFPNIDAAVAAIIKELESRDANNSTR